MNNLNIKKLFSSLLFITATNTAEAGNRVMLSWIDWFLANGYKVCVAYPGGGSMEKELIKRHKVKTLFVKSIYPSTTNLLVYITFVLKLVIFTWYNKIEIIHSNSETSYRIALDVSKLLNLKIFTHFHFHFSAEFYLWLFGKERKPDGVFYVSKALLYEERDKLDSVVPEAERWCVPNCLDISDKNYTIREKEKSSSKTSTLTICYIASVQELKNQLHLFELDKELRNLNVDAQIIAAGRGKEDEYWNQCKEREKSQGHNGRVIFKGHVEDVFDLLAKTDIVISLSRYETFGMSNLEAMFFGVPIIYYDVPAVKEVVGDGGICVAQGDIKAMASVISELSEDFQLIKSIGEIGRQRAQKYYSSKAVLPTLLECYNHVLAKKIRQYQRIKK